MKEEKKKRISKTLNEKGLIFLCKRYFVLNVIKLWVVNLVQVEQEINIFITNVIVARKELGLASYNLAMSSVPGYPIVFELENVDYLKIEVNNGNILDWNGDTGKVTSLGTTYQLSNNGTLYFNVNINTNIKITGIRNKNEVFEKNITILSDDDFNYYVILK